MIEETYVSFDIAKLLKEKGFGECSTSYISEDGDIFPTPLVKRKEHYPAPTQQMAMRWLREKYNIHIEPRYFPTPNIYRYVIIHSPAAFKNIDSHPQYFNTHEEAVEAALKYCLNNLI